MGKSIFLFCLVTIFLIFSFGCSSKSSDKSDSSSFERNQGEVLLDLIFTAFHNQNIYKTPARFTAEQIIQGELQATNTGTSTTETFQWSVYLDETTFDAQSNNNIILNQGNYDFSMLLTKGDLQYAGSASSTINDGTNNVAMAIRPVIGDTVTTVNLVSSLSVFKFQYDPTELSGLTNPQMGISVDGGLENIYTINPTAGISDIYINLSDGLHTIGLRLLDGNLQKGKSIPDQENINVVAGQDIKMDIVPLLGEVGFFRNLAGGNFNFTIPAEVVNEAGGAANLQVLFSMVGPQNPLQENLLTLIPSGANYSASITLPGLQLGNVIMSLTFSDTSSGTPEQLGSCSNSAVLTLKRNTATCDVILRRRAVIGENLLAVLGINVFNLDSEPAIGAVISNGGTTLGITGSGSFGTPGYLKVYLPSNLYSIRAEGTSFFGVETISLNPMEIHNLTIVLNRNMSNCTDCHGEPPSTGYHTNHVYGQNLSCNICHSGIDFESPNHNNGTVDVVFSGGGAMGGNTCIGIGCHGDWDWGGQVCEDCHGNPPDTGSHTIHFEYYCDRCHDGNLNTYDSPIHINGSIEIVGGSVNYNPSTGTCNPTDCHVSERW